MADMTWDEVERVLPELIAYYRGEEGYCKSKNCPWEAALCKQNAAALAHALRCVVAMRWMEERRVELRPLSSGLWGWIITGEVTESELENMGRAPRTVGGYPSALAALEAAMAAVKGESGGDN